MKLHRTPLLLAIVLLFAAPLAHAAQNCTLKLKGDDKMQFDAKTATVSASCPKITIEFTHTGKMPAQAMGHNVVISRTVDMGAVVDAGMKAGAAAGYVAKGDAKVIAATAVVGGGASTKASFAGNKLKAGGEYMYFCTFPGHSAIMKGTLVVTK
jgi:azurin